MGFKIIYKNLFEVKLLHHYFLNKGAVGYDAMDPEQKTIMEAQYDSRGIFQIIPTNECTSLLRAHNALFRSTPSGFMVGIKSVADEILPGVFNPFIKPADELTFRFLLRMKDHDLLNYTALPLQNQSGSFYVFKNYQVEGPAIFPSLSAVQPLFKPGKEYFPGDMLSDHPANQTKLFTALLRTSNNTATTTDWLEETGNATTPLSYASSGDRYPVVQGILIYKVKTANLVPAFTLKNSKGETINPLLTVITGDFYTIQADMRGFPAGFYTLHAENTNSAYLDEMTFYLLHEEILPFGLVEIKVKSNLAGFDLLDQGHLRSPVFELRFRNRLTFWRYFGKQFEVPFEVDDPLPVTRFGHIEIARPQEPDDNKVVMLPNPSTALIKPEALVNMNEKKYYSDIHIN